MAKLINLADRALIAFDNVVDYATDLNIPSIRLGVTGLSRAGKTVFITSLVHNLINGGKLPMFEPFSSGRVAGALLRPQPSMNLPRFAYEEHLSTLVKERIWPQSTTSISELRVTIAYESASAWKKTFGSGKLNIDIVDYPGEWLLDLPLLTMDYNQWSSRELAVSRLPNRKKLAEEWLRELQKTNPDSLFDELEAIRLAQAFISYLQACREDGNALSRLSPGRFLTPGDMEGSPALTFCPLPPSRKPTRNSLHSHMEKRYEAYKNHIIKPFFRNYFARIDRQIILIDALQAINAGSDALIDQEMALTDILQCFNPGKNSWLASIFSRKIDRILFAATKADHLHHENHKRLEVLLRKLADNALKRAKFSGARVNVMTVASLRSTKEATIMQNSQELPVVVGTPVKGELINQDRFDGETQTAIFPGDLPDNPALLFDNPKSNAEDSYPDLSIVRFRPPQLKYDGNGIAINLPHIRLDKALQFLLSDQLN